jgi:phosphatidylglycerophosphate synthase
MLLAPLRPAPDLVSLVAFTFGLAGGLLVHELGRDEVDGEVGRLQLQDGPRGALLDGVLDRVGDGHPGRAWAVGAGRP